MPGDEAEADFTVDTLLRGRVTLLQPRRGYRSSLDPVLLAAFVRPPFGRFLDIGCGTGAVSFLLLAADDAARGVAVELQPRLAELAAAGRDRNGWRERLEVVTADVRKPPDAFAPGTFDLVVTNPPYRLVASGYPSPDREKALAHHELSLTLGDWVAVAARAVRLGGRVAAIFPAERRNQLLRALHECDLSPLRIRHVQPYATRPAVRLLVEAEHGGRRPTVFEESLILHTEGQRFTDEVRRMLGEEEEKSTGSSGAAEDDE